MFICNFDLVENRKIVIVTSVNCNHKCLSFSATTKRLGSQIFINSAMVAKRYKSIILKSVFSVF